MKKILLSAMFVLIMLLAGCTSDAHIGIDNKTTLTIVVSGDAEGEIEPGKSGTYVFKTGGCLNFKGVNIAAPDVTIHEWDRKCFDGDNSYTFYEHDWLN